LIVIIYLFCVPNAYSFSQIYFNIAISSTAEFLNSIRK
jgi:hypothetical protein